MRPLSKRARSRLYWVATLPVLTLLGAQLFIDFQVRAAATKAGLDLSRSWLPGSATLPGSKLTRGQAASVEIGSGTSTTRIVRLNCRGSWVLGLGATLRLRDFKSEVHLSSHTRLAAGPSDLCLDVEVSPNLEELRVTQGSALQLFRGCSLELSNVEIQKKSGGFLAGRATVQFDAACADSVAPHAQRDAPMFVPQRVDIELSASGVDWAQRPLKGSSQVAFASELATRTRAAELRAQLRVLGSDGRQAELCFTKSEEGERSVFEFAFGLAESTLSSLAEPWLDQDTVSVLSALRTEHAACDGTGAGLRFDSALTKLTLKGEPLRQAPPRAEPSSWLEEWPCKERKPETGNCRYEIAVIEFDENGDFAEPEQLPLTLKSMRNSGDDGLLLSVYIHGWRHSAADGDTNLRDFKALTEAIATMEAGANGGHAPRRVLGVYLAWPAQLYASTAANKVATFWNRLKVARRVGKSGGALRQTLDALAKATSAANLVVTDPLRRSAMFVGGHSMGAEALLNAFADPEKQGAPTGDLVLLVNPAISAARFRAAQARLKAAKTPLIVYGSVRDEITQQLYPLGEALTFEGESSEALFQHTTTIANAPDLVTHRLTLAADGSMPPFFPSTLGYGVHRVPKRDQLLGALANFVESQVYRYETPTRGSAALPPLMAIEHGLEPWYRLLLCEHHPQDALGKPCDLPMAQRDTLPAQMVVAVDGDIIKSHAEFFTAAFMEHVARVIGASLYAGSTLNAAR